MVIVKLLISGKHGIILIERWEEAAVLTSSGSPRFSVGVLWGMLWVRIGSVRSGLVIPPRDGIVSS